MKNILILSAVLLCQFSGALTMKATTLPISLDLTIMGTNLGVFSVSDEVELKLTGEFDRAY